MTVCRRPWHGGPLSPQGIEAPTAGIAPTAGSTNEAGTLTTGIRVGTSTSPPWQTWSLPAPFATPGTQRGKMTPPMGSAEAIASGLAAFESQDWPAAVEALTAAGPLTPEACEALAKRQPLHS